jgi:hypothetical protein
MLAAKDPAPVDEYFLVNQKVSPCTPHLNCIGVPKEAVMVDSDPRFIHRKLLAFVNHDAFENGFPVPIVMVTPGGEYAIII